MSQFHEMLGNLLFQQLYNIDFKLLAMLLILIIVVIFVYVFYKSNYINEQIKLISLYFNAVLKAYVKKESDASIWGVGIAISAIEKYKFIKVFNEDIEIKSKHPDAWNDLGLAHSALENYEEAIKAYDKAIEISPKHVDAWNNKGLALSALENYEEAIKAYDETIEISPKHVDAWNNKGLALSALENYEEAIKAYDETIEISPKHADAWNNKGKASYNLDKYEEAIKAFDKAVEIKPNNDYTFYTLHIGMGLFNNPFLGWARKIYESKILEEFKDKIDIFSKLESIAVEEKTRIRSRVVKATEQVIAFDAWETVVDEIFNKTSLILVLLALLLSVLISLTFWFPGDRNYFDMLLLNSILLVSTFAIIYATTALVELYGLLNYTNYLKLMFVLLILYALIANALKSLNFIWLPQVVQDGVGASFVGIVGFIGAIIIFRGFISLLGYLIQRKKYHQYPDAEVINSLCLSLNLAEKDIDTWAEFDLKSKLLLRLELIAKRLENELPRSLHSYDSSTDAWMTNRSQEMAAGIRELKKNVLLSKEGSQKLLQEVLAMRLLNASDGNWDLFERRKPSNTPTTVIKIFNVLRTAIGIGLPLFIVGIIMISPIKISDTDMSYMAAVSIIWVGFNILVLIDPQYQEKMVAIKNMPENIIGWRKP